MYNVHVNTKTTQHLKHFFNFNIYMGLKSVTGFFSFN